MFSVQINNLWNRNSPTQLYYKVMEDFRIIIGKKFNKYHDESQFYIAKKKKKKPQFSSDPSVLQPVSAVCVWHRTNKFNSRELSVPIFLFVFCESWPHVHVLIMESISQIYQVLTNCFLINAHGHSQWPLLLCFEPL